MMLSFPAFAKVNLDLRILGVRPDGYHDLRTIFQSLALADIVKVEVRRGPFELRCDDPQVPTDRRNLVWKAASLLWRAARLGRGEPQDVSVALHKRIPAVRATHPHGHCMSSTGDKMVTPNENINTSTIYNFPAGSIQGIPVQTGAVPIRHGNDAAFE